MDCFLPLFQAFFLSEHKKAIKRENFNFLLIGFTLILSSLVFLLGMIMGVHIVCDLGIDWKTQLEH